MRLGITGHQDFVSPEIQDWVTTNLRLIIQRQTPDLGYTCLARGTDQIFAEILLELHVPYIAIVASTDYAKTFETDHLRSKYHSFLDSADTIIKLQYAEATEPAFYAASKLLVDKSDRIVAVWDGLPARGFGGTADVVNYAREAGKLLNQLNPRLLTIT